MADDDDGRKLVAWQWLVPVEQWEIQALREYYDVKGAEELERFCAREGYALLSVVPIREIRYQKWADLDTDAVWLAPCTVEEADMVEVRFWQWAVVQGAGSGVF